MISEFTWLNVTISVPEALKTEMDTFQEVSWSEVCRTAISKYIQTRKTPTPNIELDLESTRLESKYHQSGYPAIFMSIRIHNKMEFDVLLDRIQLHVAFDKDNRRHSVGLRYELYKQLIPSTTTITKQTYLELFREKLTELQNTFDSTFYCTIRCLVFVDGFNQPYNRELRTRIPIDEWNELLEKTLAS